MDIEVVVEFQVVPKGAAELPKESLPSNPQLLDNKPKNKIGNPIERNATEVHQTATFMVNNNEGKIGEKIGKND